MIMARNLVRMLKIGFHSIRAIKNHRAWHKLYSDNYTHKLFFSENSISFLRKIFNDTHAK
jgi:hypothetical protein